MTPDEIGKAVTIIFRGDVATQLAALQRLRATVDPAQMAWLDALIDVGIAAASAGQNGTSVVAVLLHGILTEAVWQDVVAEELEAIPGIRVFRSGYGWFDPIRFWLPGAGRTAALDICLRELRDAQSQHPLAEIVVIAHSFSTYLMSKILEEFKDIKCRRVLLCGSIIPKDYRWDKVAPAGQMLVVNEVGTKDWWPVFARVFSWGYGASGTFGFSTNRVQNRFFNWGHSDFFNPEHVREYWLPFVKNGTIVKSPWTTQRPVPSVLLSAAAALPFIKMLLLAVISGAAYLFWLLWIKMA